MDRLRRVSQVFESSQEIPIDNLTKLVLMSDCHRGDGSWADDFSRNQNIYYAALHHYYDNNYFYIELGDGDELWESYNFSDILQVHSHVLRLLSQFHKENRLFLIFGNHDIVKSNNDYVKNNLYNYYDELEKKSIPLFTGIKIHEGLILKYTPTDSKIFLTHGHQVDFFNYNLWRLARYLVRHIWRSLEIFGVNDPTSAAKNYKIKAAVERNLINWVVREKQMLVSGHTHRPRFPDAGEPPYFNTGSSVHPKSITAIEIVEGLISLVKWSTKVRNDGTLFIGKDILAGPRNLADYFSSAMNYRADT